ncbi:hypothetical protein BMETH_2075_0 [methanotrophic bacterial endosymbiont of Bathymodiolus sp.]|nr:hypothetical protein BMETH_2075_0 [methanotrophic bacterial endosymbiont of Bathymodiolus sp.]
MPGSERLLILPAYSRRVICIESDALHPPSPSQSLRAFLYRDQTSANIACLCHNEILNQGKYHLFV